MADRPRTLAPVRRLEAVAFRSWPAAATFYDGTWTIRLTAGHPSKRLNSVNPMDPGDKARLRPRLARAARRFRSYGRPLVLRQSPLCPPELAAIMDADGWAAFDESIVMTARIADMPLDGALERVPLRDTGRWIDAVIAMGAVAPDAKPGMSEIIASIGEGEAGARVREGALGQDGLVALHLAEEQDGTPLAALMAVRYADLVGLFQIVTARGRRRKGHARTLIASALTTAARQGAKSAWLQVEADNEAAVALYERLGFRQAYRYVYRMPPPSLDLTAADAGPDTSASGFSSFPSDPAS